MFSNTTVDNSITLHINKLTASEFIGKYYRPIVDLLQEAADTGDTIFLYSIGESDGDLNVYLAIETPQGKLTIINFISILFLVI